MKHLNHLLFVLLISLFALPSCRTAQEPEFLRGNVVPSPANDTLFVILPTLEDELVKVSIRTATVRFSGTDHIINGRAFFVIRSLPTDHYLVHIEVGPYSFYRYIWHERTL